MALIHFLLLAGAQAPSVENFPNELIMFGRVIMMLRGLCGEMGVRVNLMGIFSEYAHCLLHNR